MILTVRLFSYSVNFVVIEGNKNIVIYAGRTGKLRKEQGLVKEFWLELQK